MAVIISQLNDKLNQKYKSLTINLIALLSLFKAIIIYLLFLKQIMMSKRIISIFFIVVFVAFITTPAVAIIIDDSFDISYFNSISEEEEKVREIKVIPNSDSNDSDEFYLTERNMNKVYFFKKYAKPHLNIISPPPDLL